jgi:hypothetical protein
LYKPLSEVEEADINQIIQTDYYYEHTKNKNPG